jgi:hypothetical protein
MRQSTKTTFIAIRGSVLFYRAGLPLSRKTLTFASGIIRRHRASIGSLWRKLNPGQQALLVLVYLRKDETLADPAGFGVGTATAWRYVNETVELLAARAPKLGKAVRDAKKDGHAYVVLDGWTPIPIDRVAADRPFYSGKPRKHGMNLQVIVSPGGDVL